MVNLIISPKAQKDIHDTVYVDRVLYGRRDFMRILFGDVEEEEDN